MTDVEPEQIIDRMKLVPEVLRDAFYSSKLDPVIAAIAEKTGITQLQGREAGYIMNLVLVGFVHKDAMALELEEALKLDKEKAREIAEEFDKQVFALYRREMENVYAPPASTAASSPSEELVDEEQEWLAKHREEAPKAQPSKIITDTVLKPAPLPAVKKEAPLPAPLAAAKTAVPAPAPLPAAPASRIPQPATSQVLTRNTPPAPPSSVPQPFIMRANPVAERAVKSPGWKIDINSDLFKKSNAGGLASPAPGMRPAVPPRPAQLEIGAMANGKEQMAKSRKDIPVPHVPHAISPEARVVHYTEPKLSPGIPAAPAEALAEAGKPALPPMPPAPPAPQTPPSSPAPTSPKINPFERAPIVPPPPKPSPPADLPIAPKPSGERKADNQERSMPQPSPLPATETAVKKPPRVVNFGPEGDLK